MGNQHRTRREFCLDLAGIGCGLMVTGFANQWSTLAQADDSEPSGQAFKLNYIVASCMYGKHSLEEIIPEIPKTGSEHIEIWANPHGSQREELEEIGNDAFLALLDEHGVKLGAFTCFKYGLFNMRGEMDLVAELGGDLVICNSGGPKGLTGDELESAVTEFAERLKPEIAHAQKQGIRLGLENHSGGLISSPESIRLLMELIPDAEFGLAMAPYHLPQDPKLLAGLIEDLGPRLLSLQAWEHGMGCMEKLPKEQEMLQLPHRGDLDWAPIIQALADIEYAGRVEVFMHPVPRGIPILGQVSEVTDEINAARAYLNKLAEQVDVPV